MRVHELAKELGVASKDIIAALEAMGMESRSASSSVPDAAVPRLRASGGKPVTGAKPKQATEAPAKPRAKKKPAAAEKSAGKPAAKETAKPATAKKAQPKAAGAEPRAATKTKVAARAKKPVAEAEPQPPSAEPVSEPEPTPAAAAVEPAAAVSDAGLPVLKLSPGATAQDIAEKTSRTAVDVVKILFDSGEMVSATTSLSDEAVELTALELGYRVEFVSADAEEEEEEEAVDESKLRPRPPVVTVMGHVDHGKTKLLDAIRETDVVSGEHGGITQHIGAYQAHLNDREITFIDTPGHAAFTAMRARGAQATDIAVLVIAADDGVMPQTVEALDHAKAAEVPIVIAVNKVDKEEADSQRVRQQMTEHGVVPSEWGGDYEFVDVSAKARMNLDQLLETILVVADLQELKADPEGNGKGVVIEAHLDKGRGPVATVLVQRGTLAVGDCLVSGTSWAKVRALLDENGLPAKMAGPSKPVQVLGWNAVPNAGDDFREVHDERAARHVAQERETRVRAAELVSTRPTGLAQLIAATREAEIKELNVILKADVQGSLEALADAFDKLPQDEVRIKVVRKGVGAINESDVTLAVASSAFVVGFNVRPEPKAKELSDKEGVDLRLYRVIYEALDDVKSALSGLLTPEEREADLGSAEVRATFQVPRAGRAAGCMVVKGTITRDSRARLVRDSVVVYDGRIGSLRRFKDDVKEVKEGFECGISLENFQDVKEGDVIETYEVREIARSL